MIDQLGLQIIVIWFRNNLLICTFNIRIVTDRLDSNLVSAAGDEKKS